MLRSRRQGAAARDIQRPAIPRCRHGLVIPARRAAGLAAILAAVACGAGIPGCLLDEDPLPENLPPRTYLAIEGDTLRVSNYHTILSWWGTDTDGTVIGYAYRWSDPWSPEPNDSLWWEDSSWTFTSATRDTFDVPVQGSYADRTFQVRAIDNNRLADLYPISQEFRLENFPPIVSWTDTTRHPTPERPSLPAVSFAWTPQDWDGRKTIAYTRLWLDVQAGEDSAAAAITVAGSDTVGAFFMEHFQERYGERTVYLQTFDRAATASEIISWTWNVTLPQGEYLVIDNSGERTSSGPAYRQDRFWRNVKAADPPGVMDELFPGNYHVYDVWEDGVFRSSQEILPLLSLFKGVLWYGTTYSSGSTLSDDQMSEGLALAQESLLDYVSSGGAILITAHNVIGTGGGLSRSFWHDTFGIEEIFTYYDRDEWITNIRLPSKIHVQCSPLYGGLDSLEVTKPVSESEFFRVTESIAPLLWVNPELLNKKLNPEPQEGEAVYIGAIAEWGSGRIALCSTLLTSFGEKDNQNQMGKEAVESLLRHIFGL